MRRFVAVVSVVLALVVSALSAVGCGSTAHYLGGVAAHGAINHFATTPTARRRVNKVFCLYHGHRVLVDLRTHHLIGAGLNAISAYHACRGGFGRRR
jgi:hypothetical protein